MSSEAMRCTECHQFHKSDEDATAPDLTDYGSREFATLDQDGNLISFFEWVS